MRLAVGSAALRGGRAQPFVVRGEFRRRRDFVAHVVVDAFEHDERRLARDEPERLPQPADFGAVEVVLRFQRFDFEARPQRGDHA